MEEGPIYGVKRQAILLWLASESARIAANQLTKATWHGRGASWGITEEQLKEAQGIFYDLVQSQNRLMNLWMEQLGSDRRIDVQTGKNIPKP